MLDISHVFANNTKLIHEKYSLILLNCRSRRVDKYMYCTVSKIRKTLSFYQRFFVVVEISEPEARLLYANIKLLTVINMPNCCCIINARELLYLNIDV